jgi:hypothetical protein
VATVDRRRRAAAARPGAAARVVIRPAAARWGAARRAATRRGSVFAPDASLPGLFTSDGTSLYWASGSTLYACALGATCAAPTPLATDASLAAAVLLVASGGVVYWASAAAGTIMTAPATGGAVTTLCTVTDNSEQWPATVAVVDGYAYVAKQSGFETQLSPIDRCPVGGGAASQYFHSVGAMNVSTDGTSLFWLEGFQPQYVSTCAPGPTCASSTRVPGTYAPSGSRGPAGFAVYGGYVFTVGGGSETLVSRFPG